MIDKGLLLRARIVRDHMNLLGWEAHAEVLEELMLNYLNKNQSSNPKRSMKSSRTSGRKDRTCKRKKSNR